MAITSFRVDPNPTTGNVTLISVFDVPGGTVVYKKGNSVIVEHAFKNFADFTPADLGPDLGLVQLTAFQKESPQPKKTRSVLVTK